MKLSKQLTTQLPGLGLFKDSKRHQKAAGTATCTTQVAVVVMVVMRAAFAHRAAGTAAPAMGMALAGAVRSLRGMLAV
jgi:hypothetical protein